MNIHYIARERNEAIQPGRLQLLRDRTIAEEISVSYLACLEEAKLMREVIEDKNADVSRRIIIAGGPAIVKVAHLIHRVKEFMRRKSGYFDDCWVAY